MSIQTETWEHALLSKAYEAILPQRSGALPAPQFTVDLLDRAYAKCEALTAHHSRSFYLASSLLPTEKRRAVRALYAFCRISDDIVDRCEGVDAGEKLEKGEVERQLAHWRRRVSETPASDDLVVIAWTDARLRWGVPQRYAEQLIDGVAQDLQPVAYQTFDDLTDYCYGVASTVGLMSMHIIGYSGEEAIPYAIKLGVALQMTNILRDVSEDWRMGRLYLPQADLEQFDLVKGDLERGQVTPSWRNFMRFQIERNRRLYEEAWPGIAMLDRDGRFAIAAAAELYRAILKDIERHDYDVFSRRAFVSKRGKLRRLPGIWWRARRVRRK